MNPLILAQDYLTLRAVRCKSPDEWRDKGPGLCFIFPKWGGGQYVSEQFPERLWPGDVLVLGPVEGGRLIALEGGELAFDCFSVDFEHLIPLFNVREISLLQNVTDVFKRAKLYRATTALAGECQKLLAQLPPHSGLQHRSQLLKVVAAIFSVEFKEAQTRRAGYVSAEDHIVQVFEQLSAAEILNLSVEKLAGKFACSRRHLNRLFHQYFGISVAALKMEMRLLKAVLLLQDPHAKIINVAGGCGFNHLGLFNTCFKRRFGASPGQWRKKTVQGETHPPSLVQGNGSCPMQANGLCPWSGPHRLPLSGGAQRAPDSEPSHVPPFPGIGFQGGNHPALPGGIAPPGP